MAKLIQPGIPQTITPEQAIGAVMRQMEQINHTLNVLAIKIQTIQNTLITKKLVDNKELEIEWNKVTEELKTALRSAIVTPEGKPLTQAKPGSEDPAAKIPTPEPEATPINSPGHPA